MGLWEDFKNFALKGNVVELAIAVVIGLAFQAVIAALVADLITPLIGIPGHFDFSEWKTTVGSSVFLQGAFLNALISFVTIALVVFFLIVRPMAMMEERRKAKEPKAAPTTRECPECLSQVPIKAKRCAHCTSPLPPA